jgi:hypothetical protein
MDPGGPQDALQVRPEAACSCVLSDRQLTNRKGLNELIEQIKNEPVIARIVDFNLVFASSQQAFLKMNHILAEKMNRPKALTTRPSGCLPRSATELQRMYKITKFTKFTTNLCVKIKAHRG